MFTLTAHKIENLNRNSYGQVLCPMAVNLEAFNAYNQAQIYIKIAVNNGIIEAEFDTIEFDRKGRASGSAHHLELYDFDLKAKTVLVCSRRTEGNKYGVRTVSKTYYVIDGDTLHLANKTKAAKLCKALGNEFFGVAVRTLMF
jgi:hypothetical protein